MRIIINNKINKRSCLIRRRCGIKEINQSNYCKNENTNILYNI